MRLDDKLEDLRNSLAEKTNRAVDLAAEKGASSWLAVIPVKEMDLNRNKRKFKDAVHIRYDWQISDIPNVCVCGEPFNVYHAIICKRGWGEGELHYTTQEPINYVIDRVPYSSTYGCVTQMQNLTRTSPLSKYIASMKTRRNV